MILPAALILATAPAASVSDILPVALPDVDGAPALRLTEDRYHPRHPRYLIRPLREPAASDPARLRFTSRKVKLRVPLGH